MFALGVNSYLRLKIKSNSCRHFISLCKLAKLSSKFDLFLLKSSTDRCVVRVYVHIVDVLPKVHFTFRRLDEPRSLQSQTTVKNLVRV